MMRNKCQRAYYKAKDKGRGVSLDVKGSSFGRGIPRIGWVNLWTGSAWKTETEISESQGRVPRGSPKVDESALQGHIGIGKGSWKKGFPDIETLILALVASVTSASRVMAFQNSIAPVAAVGGALSISK